MANTLYATPKKVSYNFACDIIDKHFNNGNAWKNPDAPSRVSVKAINENVSFFYVENELIAVYDETSGDLWCALDELMKYREVK